MRFIKSLKIIKKSQIDSDFLLVNPPSWEKTETYFKIKENLKQLHVVNDVAEC